jgi:hypothetical protein
MPSPSGNLRREQIAALVAALDDQNTGDAEEARFELQSSFGAEAFEPLLAAAPYFSDFGRLCAIELFQSIGDARAAPLLIPWLKSDNHVVRSWTAGALGQLHVPDAIPELLAAWEASKARCTPPDWTEPVNIRRALTTLGARSQILPPKVAALACHEETFDLCWSAADLETVAKELANAAQVILYVQFWARRENTGELYGLVYSSLGIDLNPDLAWEVSIRRARDHVLAGPVPPASIATVEWVDHSDL